MWHPRARQSVYIRLFERLGQWACATRPSRQRWSCMVRSNAPPTLLRPRAAAKRRDSFGTPSRWGREARGSRQKANVRGGIASPGRLQAYQTGQTSDGGLEPVRSEPVRTLNPFVPKRFGARKGAGRAFGFGLALGANGALGAIGLSRSVPHVPAGLGSEGYRERARTRVTVLNALGDISAAFWRPARFFAGNGARGVGLPLQALTRATRSGCCAIGRGVVGEAHNLCGS
jgi:hypothetical protein